MAPLGRLSLPCHPIDLTIPSPGLGLEFHRQVSIAAFLVGRYFEYQETWLRPSIVAL